MTDPQCPFCSGGRTHFVLENSDFLFGSTSKFFQLFRCEICGAGILFPQLEGEELKAAYPEPYWWITGKSTQDLVSKLEGAYREIVLRHHVHIAKRYLQQINPRVLDIGCGSGTFLHVLEKATGVRGEGLEISQAAAQRTKETYGIDVTVGDLSTDVFPKKKFHLITMFHVLEHLASPWAALSIVRGWLADNGILLVQVPNLDSWQFYVFGKKWTGIDIPRHFFGFTRCSLEYLLTKARFNVVETSYFSLRDNAPAIISSLFPALDPVAMNIRHKLRFSFLKKILYFSIVVMAQPVALIEALFKKGGTIFIAAKPQSTEE